MVIIKIAEENSFGHRAIRIMDENNVLLGSIGISRPRNKGKTEIESVSVYKDKLLKIESEKD